MLARRPRGALVLAAVALLTTAACDATDTAPLSTPLLDASDEGSLENRRIGSRFETPSGQLTVYIDATLVGSWKIDQWRYLDRPGHVGLWLHRDDSSSERDTFDDFGAR